MENLLDELFDEMDLDLDEDLQESAPERERFEIKDLEGANWVFRKISYAKRKLKEAERLADKEMDRINKWLEQQTKDHKNDIERLESYVVEFYSKNRAIDPKYKLSTPYGKVTSRKLGYKYIYDDKKVLEHLKQNELTEYIRVKEEVDKASLKKNLTVKELIAYDENGEKIEGLTVMDQPDSITIKTEEEI